MRGVYKVRKTRRILSLLFVFSVILTMFPLQTLADNTAVTVVFGVNTPGAQLDGTTAPHSIPITLTDNIPDPLTAGALLALLDYQEDIPTPTPPPGPPNQRFAGWSMHTTPPISLSPLEIPPLEDEGSVIIVIYSLPCDDEPITFVTVREYRGGGVYNDLEHDDDYWLHDDNRTLFIHCDDGDELDLRIVGGNVQIEINFDTGGNEFLVVTLQRGNEYIYLPLPIGNTNLVPDLPEPEPVDPNATIGPGGTIYFVAVFEVCECDELCEHCDECLHCGQCVLCEYCGACAEGNCNDFTVTLNFHDGTYPGFIEQTVLCRHPATQPYLNPTRQNYEFLGWFHDDAEDPFNFNTLITANITLTARWRQLHTITLHAGAGASGEVAYWTDAPGGWEPVVVGDRITAITRQVPHDSAMPEWPDPPDNAPTNYKFDVWYPPLPYTGAYVTGPVTATAQWTRIMRTVTLNAGGGSWTTEGLPLGWEFVGDGPTATQITRQVAQGADMPDWPEPDNAPTVNHEFDGWTPPRQATVTGEVTATAQWRPIMHTITLNAGEGASWSGEPSGWIRTGSEGPITQITIQVAQGDPMPEWPVPQNAPAARNVFNGWNSPRQDGPVTGEVESTAQWRRLPPVRDTDFVPNPNPDPDPDPNPDPYPDPDPDPDPELLRAFMAGYPDDSFRPENGITRAETVAVLVRTQILDFERAAGRPPGMDSFDAFSDVNHGDWYYYYLAWAYTEGIVEGLGDGTFAPDSLITREEFAAMLVRSMGAPVAPGNIGFTDANAISDWALGYVYTANRAGWLQGFPDGSFRPQELITRAETATAKNRVLDRLYAEDAFDIIDVENLEYIADFHDISEGAWFFVAVVSATNDHWVLRCEDDNIIWKQINST